MKPVIGVLCCNEFAERPVQAVASRFIEPLSRISQATVLLVPALIDVLDAVCLSRRLDGLLLTGSRSNVGTDCYGGESRDARLDPQRDQVALKLAGHMIEAGRPVFGICRGLQELNVLFGGTLRDLCDHHPGEGHPFEHQFAHQHPVELASGGRLAAAMGVGRAVVNSVHHQGIDRLGYGLQVEALSPADGVVEAFSARPCGGAVLGVQWHPEWEIANRPDRQAFFRLLGEELMA
ncbi:gamma-glutamyl-gamma-aminobutyrate hydrolase family protein [Sandaracinobacter sp. RS1-74]|uniref:gamma-glutamyl-gamma-aminobutyrate hydrolase family protein n=1 Tax=Sandaracinobacteroides sayramensis TaxID=2913411 RepID=UPI001EDC90CD|nr:gamma-glutamyl-gamma-aminobutyrate hydrolase family protein [Sandaracinobacteroides sayramensis]MCG2842093.1 gamma-glutamyl-gamma-aminobutyrate hydrolase family protein [Sandaracinobacteroides sayramensis]